MGGLFFAAHEKILVWISDTERCAKDNRLYALLYRPEVGAEQRETQARWDTAGWGLPCVDRPSAVLSLWPAKWCLGRLVSASSCTRVRLPPDT